MIIAKFLTVKSEHSNIAFLPSIALGYSRIVAGSVLGLLLVLGQDWHLVLFQQKIVQTRVSVVLRVLSSNSERFIMKGREAYLAYDPRSMYLRRVWSLE